MERRSSTRDMFVTVMMMDSASDMPPALRSSKELPVENDNCDQLSPLNLPSTGSNNPLLNFSETTAEIKMGDDGVSLSDLQGRYADYTPAQLLELNQNLLNDSIGLDRPLIDQVVPIHELRGEYENGNGAFVAQINWLIAQGYESIRRARGDGDCFYRSLAFAYIESLFTSEDVEFAVTASISLLESTKTILDDGNVQKLVYEDVYEEFVQLIGKMADPNSGVREKSAILLSAFQDISISNSIVMYLRLLTSSQIRLHRDDYTAFIAHPDTQKPMDVDTFCSNFVEPLNKEVDNVVIEALCQALKLNVDVAYLNGANKERVDFIQIRHGIPDTTPLSLLYRPGHYDILPRSR